MHGYLNVPGFVQKGGSPHPQVVGQSQWGLTPAERGLGLGRVVLLSALLVSEPLRARLAVVAAAMIVLSHPPNMINRN